MNKIILYLFSITVLVILSSNEVFACSCIPSSDEPLAEQVKKAKIDADAVFTGKVLQITEHPEDGYISVKLEIMNLWKGNYSKEIMVSTGLNDGNCRYYFKTGETYLVYAYSTNMYSSPDILETTMCSRTRSLSGAKADIKILGKSKNFKKNKK